RARSHREDPRAGPRRRAPDLARGRRRGAPAGGRAAAVAPARGGARQRSRAGRRRLRGSQSRSSRAVSDVIELTAAQAAERVRAGELSPDELFQAYRERAAADGLNAFLWVAEGPPETGAHTREKRLG